MKVALILGALAGASAWIDNGHMLVSQIAFNDMKKSDAEFISSVIQAFELDPSNDRPYDFVTSSVWPDHIKCDNRCYLKNPVGMRVFNTWHYSDIPFNPDELANDDLIVANATGSGANTAIGVLRSSFQSLMKTQNLLTWNFLLRFITHIVGDIHQPLHAVTGFFNNSDLGQFPKGDMGGNSITIKGPYRELHLLWDMAGGKYTNNMPVPLVGQLKDELLANATLLMQMFPRAYFGGLLDKNDYHNNAFRNWAQESFDIAANTTYKGIQINTYPSEEYLAKTVAVCDARIALGGYRLADVLRKILENRPSMEEYLRQRTILDAERLSAAETIKAGRKYNASERYEILRPSFRAGSSNPVETIRSAWWVGLVGIALGAALVGLVVVAAHAWKSRTAPLQYVSVERDPLLPA